jgi:3-oxoadipate enol-lactonase
MPFANLRSVRLHYELVGPADAPVVVFSNSLGADLSMWNPQAAEFSRRHRVLRYDTRGHGESSLPTGPHNLSALAGDVLDLLDYLAIPVVFFCGLSLGGLTGLWLAQNAPKRIR